MRFPCSFLDVDPQNDFCVKADGQGNEGALDDTRRFAAMIRRLGRKISGIFDFHNASNTEAGERRALGAIADVRPLDADGLVAYTQGGVNLNMFGMSPTEEEYTTRAAGTERCVVGAWGWSVVPDLHVALCEWFVRNPGKDAYVIVEPLPGTVR